MPSQSWGNQIWNWLPNEMTSVFGTKTLESNKARGIAVETHCPRAVLKKCVQHCNRTGTAAASKFEVEQKQVKTVTNAEMAKPVSNVAMNKTISDDTENKSTSIDTSSLTHPNESRSIAASLKYFPLRMKNFPARRGRADIMLRRGKGSDMILDEIVVFDIEDMSTTDFCLKETKDSGSMKFGRPMIKEVQVKAAYAGLPDNAEFPVNAGFQYNEGQADNAELVGMETKSQFPVVDNEKVVCLSTCTELHDVSLLECNRLENDLIVNNVITPLTILACECKHEFDKNEFDTPGDELYIFKGSPQRRNISHFPMDLDSPRRGGTLSNTDTMKYNEGCDTMILDSINFVSLE